MKRWLKLALALILLVVMAILGIAGFLGYSMTKVERVPLEKNPALVGLRYEDVSFFSVADGLRLRGWLLPVEDSEPVIIMLHGEEKHRADASIGMLDIASGLVARSYNVLMFDLRGHGESEGNRMSAGYYEKRDLLGAVNYVKKRGFESIGVLGFSMGAVTALLAAVESQDIDAIVMDSSFADLKDIMEPEFAKRTKFPKFLLRPLLLMVKIMFGVDFSALEPVKLVPQIAPIPIFFIHGELDDIIPVEHAYRLQSASQSPQNELWVAPGAGHVRSYAINPEEYLKRLTAFLDKALK